MTDQNNHTPVSDEALLALDTLADEFLDLWQENIRLWSEEKDLFTLRNFVDGLKPNDELHAGNTGENTDAA